MTPDDALDAHTRDAQETYGAFRADDPPNPIALIEWLTAQSYERMADKGDAVCAACVTGIAIDDVLRVCEERALYYYLLYHAKVSGDL